MPTAANRVVEDPGEVGGAVDPAVLVDGVGDQSLGVLGRTDITKVHHSLAAGLFDRVDGLLVRFRAFAFPVNIGSEIVDDGRTDSAEFDRCTLSETVAATGYDEHLVRQHHHNTPRNIQ